MNLTDGARKEVKLKLDTQVLVCYDHQRLNSNGIAQPARFSILANQRPLLHNQHKPTCTQFPALAWFCLSLVTRTGRLFLFQRALIARIKDIMATAKCKQCKTTVTLQNDQATRLAARYGVLCESCRGNGRQHSKMEHAEYTQSSSHWQTFKARALKHYGRKCYLCGSTKGVIDVHHNDYTRKGSELLSDVVPLCRDCHSKHHSK